MALTINDLEEFVHILKEHPEWRQRIVHVLFNGNVPPTRDAIDRLAEQVQLLTEQVRLLTERMDRLEQRVGRLEQRVEEGFKQVNERIDSLEQRIDRLEQRTDERFTQVDERFNQIDERFNQVDERFNQIDERIDRLEQRTDGRFNQIDERIDRLEQRTDERFNQVDERFNQVDERFNQVERDIRKLQNRVGSLVGESLESRYRNHIGNFFGRVLRRVRVVDIRTIEEELETRITDEAFEALLNLDLLATGKVKHHLDRPEVWVAIEISATINTNDVIRARQRADILCSAGYPAVAVVGGEECSLDAIALAQETNVVIIQDGGQMTGWDEAFAPILPMIAE